MSKQQTVGRKRYSDCATRSSRGSSRAATANAGAWNKARRAEGQGSNDQRVRRAWSAALAMSAQARKRVEAHEAERKAERAEAFKAPQATKATKAPAAGSRTRKAGGARTARKGAKEGHSETAAEVVAKVSAGERTRARRARKAAA